MSARPAIAALLSMLLLGTPSVRAAAPANAGNDEVLTGRVLEVLPQQMLLVQSGTRRVLVYAQQGAGGLDLRPGLAIRIEGQVPRDWLRLSQDELQARRIELLD